VRRGLFERCVSEVAGTALLVGIGTGAIVAAANAGGRPPSEIAVAWFAAVAVPVVTLAYVSGAHINPVVTLALVLAGRFPARESPAYVGAQVAGAFLGSGIVLLSLGRAAHLGATLPSANATLLVFPLEFGFTLALIVSVFYLTTPGKVPSRLELLLPAAVVGVSTYLIGPWTGSSLNPARTIAPAVLSGAYTEIWVYFAATISAAVLGALLFRWRERETSSPPTRRGEGAPCRLI
jgi:glycerol uptake facilitator-like aquaporin